MKASGPAETRPGGGGGVLSLKKGTNCGLISDTPEKGGLSSHYILQKGSCN